MRKWVTTHLSSVTIRPDFVGSENWHPRRRLERRLFEPLTTFYAWMLAAACWQGVLAGSTALILCSCTQCVLLINAVRTRYAHRYAFNGEAVNYRSQIEDTATHEQGICLALLAPVGLRYHTLHHLFPHLPYHAMQEAHRRIVTSPLPAAEVYRSTCHDARPPSAVSSLSIGK